MIMVIWAADFGRGRLGMASARTTALSAYGDFGGITDQASEVLLIDHEPTELRQAEYNLRHS